MTHRTGVEAGPAAGALAEALAKQALARAEGFKASQVRAQPRAVKYGQTRLNVVKNGQKLRVWSHVVARGA
jgi:hypothetical protein